MSSPNKSLQRLERSGESAKGILLHPMEQKAEGRACRAAHESTAPPTIASRLQSIQSFATLAAFCKKTSVNQGFHFPGGPFVTLLH
jgi:hypothetical protein